MPPVRPLRASARIAITACAFLAAIAPLFAAGGSWPRAESPAAPWASPATLPPSASSPSLFGSEMQACQCSSAADEAPFLLPLAGSATTALTGLDARFAEAVDPLPDTPLPPSTTPSIVGSERSPFDDLDDESQDSSVLPSSLELTPASDKPYWRSNIFKRFLHDQAFLVTKWWPSEVTRWSFTAPLVVSTYSASRSSDDENSFDYRAEQRIDTGSGKRSNGVATIFTKLGNGAPACAALGITYLLARHSGHDRLAEASSVSFEALISTGLWVEFLKEITARERPVQGSHGEFFQYGKPESSSFPSGHSMGAFTVATVFAHVYADKKWVPWVAYGSAGLVAWSRVALGRHFPSDVIAGAILGNSMGRMALTRDGRLGELTGGRWQPIFDPKTHTIGVGYSYSW